MHKTVRGGRTKHDIEGVLQERDVFERGERDGGHLPKKKGSVERLRLERY